MRGLWLRVLSGEFRVQGSGSALPPQGFPLTRLIWRLLRLSKGNLGGSIGWLLKRAHKFSLGCRVYRA